MLTNAYFLAKIGADTAENEQHFAEFLPKTGNYPTGLEGGPRPLGFGADPGELPGARLGPRDKNLLSLGLTLSYDGFLSNSLTVI